MIRKIIICVQLCLLVLQWTAEAAAQSGSDSRESQFFRWWRKKPPVASASKKETFAPEAMPAAAEKPPEFAPLAASPSASYLLPSATSSNQVKPWKPNLIQRASGAFNRGQRSMRKYTLCPVCLIAATGLKFYGKDALGPNSPGQSLICMPTGVLDFVCRKILSDLVASQIQYVEPHESCRAIGFCLRLDDKGNPYPAGKDMPSLLPLKEAKLRDKGQTPAAPKQSPAPEPGQPPIQPPSVHSASVGSLSVPQIARATKEDEDADFPPFRPPALQPPKSEVEENDDNDEEEEETDE